MSPRVLIVDDDPGLLDFVSLRPDLALLDFKLEGMDGFALMRRLHGLLPGLPVIFLSGHISATTASDAIGLGAAALIEKPFDPETLELVVLETLRKQR